VAQMERDVAAANVRVAVLQQDKFALQDKVLQLQVPLVSPFPTALASLSAPIFSQHRFQFWVEPHLPRSVSPLTRISAPAVSLPPPHCSTFRSHATLTSPSLPLAPACLLAGPLLHGKSSGER